MDLHGGAWIGWVLAGGPILLYAVEEIRKDQAFKDLVVHGPFVKRPAPECLATFFPRWTLPLKGALAKPLGPKNTTFLLKASALNEHITTEDGDPTTETFAIAAADTSAFPVALRFDTAWYPMSGDDPRRRGAPRSDAGMLHLPGPVAAFLRSHPGSGFIVGEGWTVCYMTERGHADVLKPVEHLEAFMRTCRAGTGGWLPAPPAAEEMDDPRGV